MSSAPSLAVKAMSSVYPLGPRRRGLAPVRYCQPAARLGEMRHFLTLVLCYEADIPAHQEGILSRLRLGTPPKRDVAKSPH